jgi:hypothetical protein
MNVMSLLQAPVFPNPESNVMAMDFDLREDISIPTSPSVPTMIGRSSSDCSWISFAVLMIRPGFRQLRIVAQHQTPNHLQLMESIT